MLKMTIDNEEVVSKNNFTIKEEMLSPSSTILNNTYPKTWEQDHDYTSRFYYPKDYAKLDIQNFSITPEEAGTTIDINGSATLSDVDTTKESRVLSLKGQTSQTTYSGKNLLHQDQYITTRTTNGITYTNNGDGTFSITGTATANTNIQILTGASQIGLESGKTYYFYSSKPYNSTDFNLSIPFAQDGTQKYLTANNTITTSGTLTNIKLSFWVSTGTTVNAQNVKLMLVEGSSAGTYEPYVGGTASPNPQYPQPINVVSGDNYINICGKNLANPNNLHLGHSLNDRGALLSNNPSRTTLYQINVVPNTQFNLSTSANYQIGNLFYYDINKTYLSTQASSYSNNKNTTTPNNAYYISFVIRRADNGTMTQSDIEALHAQIEKGSTATTYEPYIGNSYPIYLGVENLFNISTITVGYSINTSGVLVENSVWNSGDYIEVQPSTTYTYSADYTTTGNITYSFYNSSKTFISRTGGTGSPITFTTDSATKYVRLAYRNDQGINNIQLEKGSKKNSYSAYGTTPIELCKIGTYQDKIYKGVGSNLFKGYDNMTSGFLPASGAYPTTNSSYPNARYQLIELKAGQSITTSNSTNQQGRLRYIDKTTNQVIGSIANETNEYYVSTGYYGGGFNSGTITAKKDFIVGVMLLQDITQDTQLMINEGTSSLPYEPYNSKDKWLLHKEIGKVVLNGSESWQLYGGVFYIDSVINDYLKESSITTFCNYFKGATNKTTQQGAYENGNNTTCFRIGDSINRFIIRDDSCSTANDFKTWLASNNLIVYYVLATPTTTEITDTTLLEQLDDLESQ